MTPFQYYKATEKLEILRVCTEAGTSFNNFKKIALASGSCSSRLAAKLSKASKSVMTEMEILYPNRFDASGNSQ